MPSQLSGWRSFRANTLLTGGQDQSKIVHLANGDFWVTWRDFGDAAPGDGSPGSDIFGQRYNALGEAQGGPVRLNSFFAADNENSADFAARGTSFFVAYENTRISGGYADIVLERHSANGAGEAFTIIATDPTFTNAGINLFDPHVAIASATNGVVVYERRNGGSVDFVARFFNPTTLALGAEVLITSPPGGQLLDLIALPDGNYAISWEQFTPATQFDVGYRVFNQSGGAVGTPVLAATSASETDLTIAALSSGAIVYAFAESGDISIRRSNGGGASIFGFDVQTAPAVIGTADGGFVIVWLNSTDDAIMAQSYSATAEPIGTEIIVATAVRLAGPMSLTLLGDGRVLLSYDGQDFPYDGNVDTFAAIIDPRASGEANGVYYPPDTRQIGTNGQDVFTATAAFVNGWNNADTITDGLGNNHIRGDAGFDRIIIDGVSAAESADGGADTDTLEIINLTAVASIDLAVGIVGSGGVTQIVSNFENFASATSFNLVVFGTSPIAFSTTGRNILATGAGDDALYGFGGDDELRAGNGNDVLDGGLGDDDLHGGPGDDLFIVDNSGDLAIELAGEGVDEVRTALPVYVLPANVERLLYTGTAPADLSGNAGDNIITGGPGADLIRLQHGAQDSAFGGGGDDGFYFGAAMTNLDAVDGGPGIDQIGLQGVYNFFSFGTNGAVGVEFIVLLPGDDTRFANLGGALTAYNITTLDANIAANQILTFQANTLRAGENFTLNGSAETDGIFLTFGGLGTDNLTGGSQSDGFYFGTGRFNPGDVVNGGGGTQDQIGLQGDYAGANQLFLGSGQMTNVEFIVLLSASDTRFGGGSVGQAFSYNITMNNGNVAAGQQLIIQANTLLATETLTFFGAAEADGSFRVFGGAGNDRIDGGAQADDITGGAGADVITGNGGADILRGGAGNDLFTYVSATQSTAAARDRILDFTTGDILNLFPLDANPFITGNQRFELIASGTAFTGAGQLRITQTGNNALIEGDTNGDGTADLVIDVIVVDGHALGLADFSGVTDNQAANIHVFDQAAVGETWPWKSRFDLGFEPQLLPTSDLLI